jgi:hypothetical protein
LLDNSVLAGHVVWADAVTDPFSRSRIRIFLVEPVQIQIMFDDCGLAEAFMSQRYFRNQLAVNTPYLTNLVIIIFFTVFET